MLKNNFKKIFYLIVFLIFCFPQSFLFALSIKDNDNRISIEPLTRFKLTSKDNIIKTVISKGKGASFEEARFLAAQNALLSIFHGIFLQKSMSGQNQDEAIASSCLVLATALELFD